MKWLNIHLQVLIICLTILPITAQGVVEVVFQNGVVQTDPNDYKIQDIIIRSDLPYRWYSGEIYYGFIGKDIYFENREFRTLIRCNLDFPAGTIIHSAYLAMYMYDADDFSYVENIGVYNCLQQGWKPGKPNEQVDISLIGTNWDNIKQDDANGPNVPWNAAGADANTDSNTYDGLYDRATTAVDSVAVSAMGWYLWDITSASQDWLQNDTEKYGLILLDEDNYVSVGLKRFRASEGASDVISFRPKFVFYVTFPPENCADIDSEGLTLSGDLNADCKVNFKDFVYFAQEWLNCNDPQNPGCS
jgi:hypothetical protein